jgi:hypothetical protein
MTKTNTNTNTNTKTKQKTNTKKKTKTKWERSEGDQNKVQNGKKGKSSVSKINDETTAKLANVYG